MVAKPNAATEHAKENAPPPAPPLPQTPADVLGLVLGDIVSGKIGMLQARERIRQYFSSLSREDYEAVRKSRLELSNRIVSAADGVAQELATIAAPVAEP